MWIKICGITDIISALHCEMEKVNAIGLVFVPWSPRFISMEQLKKMSPHLKRINIMKIGVFAGNSEEEIKEVLEILPLDGIQFHGNEDLSFLEKFKEYFLIRALNIDEEVDLEENIEKFSKLAYILLDKSKKSDMSFEEFIRKVKNYVDKKVIIAGGINESNVDMALELDPFGLDLSSGVEIEKGKKDLIKISNFMRKVRDYEKNRL
ncbi:MULTISPECIES: phosphoribosylanthranilate isomerase [Dictyoglomus]|jgi:phosphoribosylanthranilate isomerase|uniref:N-(5'-phosphoribosyl)anthranilate isomerase n=1 Tax=Dictyoglomus turgidum (strain DSM 6724 / Z-1310) TaxID=515635 RepID=B8DZP6_DICTD|nr:MULTISPECIES: phosphoribosylanthranilate isomerase [Dictyoglomus]ACK41979.1 Phosphoribosylanthranilate isomerase [Dictyoglomus turgidum DSM 6724]PNV79277.1 MAG: phosphoribosylanthranilate isomerase [Dictyoglomus turgidum]HBU31461.1 phosphoribosylanthranilate isomerase [Dictyoglomus sp.]